MTEREKMVQGLWYDANFDPELLKARNQAADLLFELSQTRPSDEEKKGELMRRLLPNKAESASVLYPFLCDYGANCYIGKQAFINYNCYLMDGAKITIGENTFIGPFCGFYTANHPLDYTLRNKGLELAAPITIGANVWLGGNVVVLPGVTIGDGSVIGAGSVVTKDIPAGMVAVGNPCKVIGTVAEKAKNKL